MRWTWLAALFLLPAAAASPLLVAVAPDLPGSHPGDEGFAVGCPQACDLGGWSVTDGEGAWTLPALHLDAGGVAWFTANATVWREHDGPTPAAVFGGVQLANAGDSLTLRSPAGQASDSFTWGKGGVTYVSPGLVYTRDGAPGAWVDTDQPADWQTPREHRIGESSLDQPTWTVDRLTAYASPDSSFATLTSTIASATQRLHLHVYEMRSAELVDALVAAKQAHPQLDLAVLVDENPVGFTATDRHASAYALGRIQDAGGSVVLAGPGRYDDFHLKVLVADDQVAVQSENWVPTGVPPDPSTGNRGWGVVLHSKDAADWFAHWMAADRVAWDAKPFDRAAYDPLYEQPGRAAPRTGAYGPAVAAREFAGPIRVRPLVAPDHTHDPRSDPLAAIVAGARSIAVQQLDLASGAKNSLGWSSADPLLDALEQAARRGATVRVQAAAPFSSSDAGNGPQLDELRAAGAQAEVIARPGIETLHNKGLIADGTVVVGSMNGNHHSRSANREVDVVVESPEVAAYFRALFDSDWTGQEAPRDTSVFGHDLRGLPAAPWPTLFGLLGVALLARR